MSSIMTSQGAVLATAVAVSGTVILLAFRLQKSLPTPLTPQFSFNPLPQSQPSTPPPSCLSNSEGKKKEKKKKRVKFAEDVMDPSGDSEEYRKLQQSNKSKAVSNSPSTSSTTLNKSFTSSSSNISVKVQRRMPANRVALYNGILRDRVLHRVAYSY